MDAGGGIKNRRGPVICLTLDSIQIKKNKIKKIKKKIGEGRHSNWQSEGISM